jgi:hypothetical protein
MTLDEAFNRLRELTEPASHECVWCCAVWRLTLCDMAENPKRDRDITLDDEAVAAEVRALQVDHPNAYICSDHRAKLAEFVGAAPVQAVTPTGRVAAEDVWTRPQHTWGQDGAIEP